MRRFLGCGGVAAALLLSAGLAGPAHATDSAPGPVPPGRITLDVVTVNGSGCPAGTAAVAMAPDNTAFTVTYSDYLAQVGPDATATQSRRNCQINVRVNTPQGFTYAVAKADYRGYASLARGASARLRANYYFQGESETTSLSHTFTGPRNGDWQRTHATDVASLVFAPCGEQRLLNVNSSLVVDEGTSAEGSSSFVAMDSTDGSVSTTYQLSWRTCE